MPDDFVKPREQKKYDKMKKEGELQANNSLMEPQPMEADPLSQPERDTGRGIGEKKKKSRKMFKEMTEGGFKMEKKKVIDEEVEKQEDKEEVEKEPAEEEAEKKKEVSEDEVEKSEDSDEEEEDEEEKKKKAMKGESGGDNPEEDTSDATTPVNTITPEMSVPSAPQDVFVPPSSIDVAREQVTPMGKSVNPDLMKSPLYKSLSVQIDGIREAVSKKVDALEKSVNDRLNNVLKDMDKIETFYKQSFYKAIDDGVGPEGIQSQSISKQIEAGKVRFRNK